VAQAAGALHHELVDGDVALGVVRYLIVFFAIWWTWVNFTWFASAYDTDDVAYRVLTFVQIAGVLVVSAGVPSAFEQLDFSIIVLGYVIMRSALVVQWLRVAREDPGHRVTALRFAIGIGLVQLLWVGRLAIGPPLGFVAIVLLGVAEMAIPVFAERAGRPTPWHPLHVAERYGLFTIIVLGECVLAASTAVQEALAARAASAGLLAIALGGLGLVFALWWLYFKRRTMVDHAAPMRSAFAWGYGHYVVFAAAAAMGAGLQVAIDSTHEEAALAPIAAALTVGVPAAIYVAAVAILHTRPGTVVALARLLLPVALLVGPALAAHWVGVPAAVLAMGALIGSYVAIVVVPGARRSDAALAAERASP
jgi:low temperature requirement protein LtrA